MSPLMGSIRSTDSMGGEGGGCLVWGHTKVYLSSFPIAQASLLLGGSWVAISRVISPLIWVICIVTLLTTLLIATRVPPSRP